MSRKQGELAQQAEEQKKEPPAKKKKKTDDARVEIDKMRMITSMVNDQGSFFGPNYGQQRAAKNRLEFSHSTISIYKKHSKVVEGLIVNNNTNCLTTFNDKSIHMWNPLTLERYFYTSFVSAAETEFIQCMCYSQRWHLYFACTQNFKLLVLNEYLKRVWDLQLEVRLVTHCQFIDETNQLVVAGVGGAHLIDMEIIYKYSPSQAILLDPKGTSIVIRIKFKEGIAQEVIDALKDKPEEETPTSGNKKDKKRERKDSADAKSKENVTMTGEQRKKLYSIYQLLGPTKWSAGILAEASKNLLVQWTKRHVYFYDFQPKRKAWENAQALRIYQNIAQADDCIATLALFDSLQYFVVGKQFGEIVIWKYGDNTKEGQGDSQPQSQVGGPSRTSTGVRKNLETPDAPPSPGAMKPEQSVMGITAKSEDFNELGQYVVKGKLNKPIHTFKSHTRGITSIQRVRSSVSNTFVSASTDGTVRVWCLDKLIELYVFDITQGEGDNRMEDKLTNIMLLNAHTYALFYAGQHNAVVIGQISHLAHSYHISNSQISQVRKAYSDYNKMYLNEPKSLLIGFDNNSTFMLRPSDGFTKSTIYPPPSSTKIKVTMFCMAMKRIVVMLSNGAFCVYRVHKRSTGKLQVMQYSKQIKNVERKSLSQQVTCMTLCSIEPPMFDCEIFSNIDNKNNDFENSPQLDNDSDTSCSRASDSDSDCEEVDIQGGRQANDHFLVMGLAKGAIVFVRVDKLDRIYARFTLHKQSVEQIYEIRSQKKLISICSEFMMNLWGFENGELVPYVTYNLLMSINQIKILDSSLFFVFPSGETRLLRWDDEKKNMVTTMPTKQELENREPTTREIIDKAMEDIIKRGNCMKEIDLAAPEQLEHESPVLSVDIHEHKQLFATGDREGLIKIWNMKKEIVREIKFTEPITAICFLNNEADLLVGHGCRLSRVYAKDYAPSKGFVPLPLKYKLMDFGYEEDASDMVEMHAMKGYDQVRRISIDEIAKFAKYKCGAVAFCLGPPPYVGSPIIAEHAWAFTSFKRSFTTEGCYPLYLFSTELEEFHETQQEIDQSFFVQIFRNHELIRKQDGGKSFTQELSGGPKRKELPPDDFNPDECDKRAALKMTREMQRKKKEKTTGKSQKTETEDQKNHDHVHKKNASPSKQNKKGQEQRRDSVDSTDAQLLNVALDLAVKDQQQKDKGRTDRARSHPAGGKRSSTGPAAKAQNQEQQEIFNDTSDALQELGKQRMYLNEYKAGATNALPKSLLKNIASEKSRVSKIARSRKPMTRQQMTRERIADNIQSYNTPDGSWSYAALANQSKNEQFGIFGQSASTQSTIQPHNMSNIRPYEDFKDFHNQLIPSELDGPIVAHIKRNELTVSSSEEPASATYKHNMNISGSNSNLQMRPMQIFEKPQQLYSNVIEITKNNVGAHSSKYFPHTTIEGTVGMASMTQATSKKGVGYNQLVAPRVAPIAILNAKQHPISAQGQRIPANVKVYGQFIKGAQNTTSCPPISNSPPHGAVLSIDTGAASSAAMRTAVPRNYSQGVVGRSPAKRPATIGGGMRVCAPAGDQKNNVVPNYGLRGIQQQQRNKMRIRQSQLGKHVSVPPQIFNSAMPPSAHKMEAGNQFLVEVPQIDDHQEYMTRGSSTALYDINKMTNVPIQFHTQTDPRMKGPPQSSHATRPKPFNMSGTGIRLNRQDAGKAAQQEYQTVMNVQANNLSNNAIYQKRTGSKPPKLGTANSSDLNFMLGPSTGNTALTDHKHGGGQRLSGPAASSVFQSGQTFNPPLQIEKQSQLSANQSVSNNSRVLRQSIKR